MLGAITVVGAIVGLLTGVFTVWDRWARGRPLASVTATRWLAGDPQKSIHITNPGLSHVLILGGRGYPKTPPMYGVAKDLSARALIWSSLYGDDVNVLLPPGKDQYLPIIELPKDLD